MRRRDVNRDRSARLLSLRIDGTLAPRTGEDGLGTQAPSDTSLDKYVMVEPDQLVVNPMWLTGGSIGVSKISGAVSPAYRVYDFPTEVTAAFAHHALRSHPFRSQYAMLGRGETTFDRSVSADDFENLRLAWPDTAEQRRIADFLDDRVGRIDRIIAARRAQAVRLAERHAREAYDTVSGRSVAGERRASPLPWLHDLPAHWPVLTVGSQFRVELGKMLDEKRQTGQFAVPYLRNTNVQWDEISTDDLKSMDIHPSELQRFTVRTGDLLICEGGQPGRAAIWDGRSTPMGYQKALHRARSNGRSLPQWLLECLRVAVRLNVFAAGSSVTTISHLTNEQLRAQRFPFPDSAVQREALQHLERVRQETQTSSGALTRSIALLTEYKQSLITAAVTRQFDVTTASTRIPE